MAQELSFEQQLLQSFEETDRKKSPKEELGLALSSYFRATANAAHLVALTTELGIVALQSSVASSRAEALEKAMRLDAKLYLTKASASAQADAISRASAQQPQA